MQIEQSGDVHCMLGATVYTTARVLVCVFYWLVEVCWLGKIVNSLWVMSHHSSTFLSVINTVYSSHHISPTLD